ncbi:hypothetical protein, partial [Chromobacterium haemolyticum]|uniref:hypothetical protein n=1 Tax=Chromobacterium haemolyticum TaxID=394935 RepID=UPI001C384797
PEADVLAEKQRGGGILTPEVRPESAKYGLRAQKQQLQRRWLRQVAENFICVRACLVFDCLKQVSGSPLKPWNCRPPTTSIFPKRQSANQTTPAHSA